MKKCNHEEVIYEKEYDPHKGCYTDTYCKQCGKLVYYYNGEYYDYAETKKRP